MVIERMICLSNGSGTLPVEVRQNDYNAVEVRLLVYETPNALLDMTGMIATVSYEKDGVPSEPYEVKVEEKNHLRFTFPACMAAEAGKGLMQIALYAQDAIAHSYTMPFVVEYSIPMPAPGSAKDPAPAFFQLIQESLEAVREMENIVQIGEDYHWRIWSHALKEYISTEKLAIPAIQFEVETGKPGEQVQMEVRGPLDRPVIKLIIPPGRDGQINGLKFYDDTPLGLGKANSGSSMQMARGDHAHPMPRLDELVGILPIGKGGLGVDNVDDAKKILGIQTYDDIPQVQTESITLAAADWTQKGELYEQTVPVTGMSADTSQTSAIVSPAPDRANEKQYHNAEVRASLQGEGTITFTCVELPATDVVVNVMIVAMGSGMTGSGSADTGSGDGNGTGDNCACEAITDEDLEAILK